MLGAPARKPTLYAVNQDGDTPLHIAAREGNLDVVKYASMAVGPECALASPMSLHPFVSRQEWTAQLSRLGAVARELIAGRDPLLVMPMVVHVSLQGYALIVG
jgi:ankyrin repeat protein